MDNVTIIKIVIIILVFLSTLFSTLLPTILRITTGTKKKGKLVSLLEWFLHVSQGFAAGVLLSAGISHILFENSNELQETIVKLINDDDSQWNDFPFGHAAAAIAFGAFYLLETTTTQILTCIVSKRKSKKEHHDSNDEIIVEDADFTGKKRSNSVHSIHESTSLVRGSNSATYYSIEKSVNVSESDSEDSVKWATKKESEHTHGFDLANLSNQSFGSVAISCFVLWLSLFSHSFIEGLSMGLQKDFSNFATLLLAIMFHKLFAAYSLGVVVANAAGLAKSILIYIISIVFIISFSISTPVGIAVGMSVTNTDFKDDPWFIISTSSLLCASAGVFIFISVFELLFESGEKHHIYGNKLFTSTVFNFLFSIGIIGMVIIAYWA